MCVVCVCCSVVKVKVKLIHGSHDTFLHREQVAMPTSAWHENPNTLKLQNKQSVVCALDRVDAILSKLSHFCSNIFGKLDISTM